jgi:hypothetical protein
MFTGEAASTLGWVRAGIWLVAATLVIIGAGPGFRRPDTASDRDLRP